MHATAFYEGKFLPLSEVKVPALDRGYLFGDGVYEVVRIYRGLPFLFEEHVARFRRSLDEMRIGGIDIARLKRELLALLDETRLDEAMLYWQVTRGAAGTRAHAFPGAEVPPTTLMYVQPFVDTHAPKRVTGCDAVTYPDIRWGRCDIKSLNLMGNVFASQAAKEAGAYDTLLVKPDGTVTEGAHTSFFGVSGGALRTAPCSPAILPGITRALVIRLALEAGYAVEERALTRDGLAGCGEAFFTGTTTEVLPIVRIDGAHVGNGEVGAVTRELQRRYAFAVSSKL